MSALQKKQVIYEKEYTFQKISPREWMRLRKRCSKNGVLDDEKFADEVLEHIVIEPKVKLDDFEDYGEVEDLVSAAVNFQYGKAIL